MATIYNVYNAKKQQLNSTKLHNLFKFFSDNYSGVVNYKIKENEIIHEYDTDAKMNSVVSINTDNNNVIIQASSMSMILGGMLFTMSHPEGDDTDVFCGPYELTNEYNLIGLIVDLDSIQENESNTIIHNRLHDSDFIPYSNNNSNIPNFGFYRVKGFDIAQNSEGLYTITKKSGYYVDSQDWSNGYRFNAIKINNINISDTSQRSGYLIPVAAKINNNGCVRLLECHSKSSLEEFLTFSAIEKLKRDLDDEYVHRSGSVEGHDDYGRIGALKIEGNHLKTSTTSINSNILNLDFKTINLNEIDHGVVSAGEPLVIDGSNKLVPVKFLDISQGGTNANNRAEAKINLGITYGSDVPSDDVGIDGDIFFKIIG